RARPSDLRVVVGDPGTRPSLDTALPPLLYINRPSYSLTAHPMRVIRLPDDSSIHSHNQAIGKEGRKLASFLGINAKTPALTPLHIDDWRSFSREEKKKLVEFVKRRIQANRNNRAKQKMPQTGGSKSIATLMDEKDMINERLINSERSNDHPHNISWEGDVYSQVLRNEKSGCVRGLGLGPTPSLLWGSNLA
ncbi:hypothetical protein HAX54_011977, partial [Datura stramonium]|nr:hypothetical protein [Datura stramonium]